MLLAVCLAGCAAAAPAPAPEPSARIPALPEPLTVHIAAPSAAAPVAEAPPADAGVVTPAPPPKVSVPEGKCSGRALGLEDVQMRCACHTDAADRAASPLCPGTPQGQSAVVPGLVVSLELDAETVKSGGLVRGTVRFRNVSDGALALHFMRDSAVALELLTEAGAAIPRDGVSDCVATLSLAKLAGVTLAPGGEVVVKAVTTATKRRHRPGCNTAAAGPLPAGRYSVGIAESPLYAKAQTPPVPVEVTK